MGKTKNFTKGGYKSKQEWSSDYFSQLSFLQSVFLFIIKINKIIIYNGKNDC